MILLIARSEIGNVGGEEMTGGRICGMNSNVPRECTMVQSMKKRALVGKSNFRHGIGRLHLKEGHRHHG